MLGITRKQMIMLGILISGSFIAILNQTIVAPALPTIMREMNVTASTVQWLTTGFTLVNAVVIPISAYLTDRFSVRSLFIVVMSIFCLGTALAAWGPSFEILLAGRIVQALGAGVLMPMVMTMMLLTFPVEHRGTAMGLFNIIIAFAPTIGPVVAGIVIDHATWHIMFIAVAALALIDVLLAIFFLHTDQIGDPTVEGVDKPSVVLSTFGFGSMLYGFSVIGNTGINAPAIISVAMGFLVVVLFFRRQHRLDKPMLRVETLRSRKFLIGTIISMLVQAATMANAVLIPIFVQTICGQTATVSALVLLPGSIMMGVMGPISGRIFDRRGPRGIVISGLITVTIGTILMSTLTLSTGMLVLTVFLLIRLTGLACVNMPVTTWGMNSLENRVINHGNAVNNTLRQVAGSLGAALVISSYSLFSSFNTESMGLQQAQVAGINFAFALQAVLLGAGLIVAIIFVRDRPGDAAKADPTGERRAHLETIMTHDVYALPADSKVLDAAMLFVEKHIDDAPIIDNDGKLLGFVSDGDIMRALMPSHESKFAVDPTIVLMGSERLDPDLGHWFGQVMQMPILQIATPRVISVDAHASIADVYRTLGDNHLRRAPVLDNGKLVGMISRFDVTASALREHIEREHEASPSL